MSSATTTTTTDMNGKVVVVTGGTSGIGRETALALAAKGAEVVLVARDADKAGAVVAEITAAGGCARFTVADLSSIADVRRAAGELARLPRLDVLVNNAGGAYTEHALTREGIERTWALNHLAYMALTLELVPLLRATAAAHGGARIVNVASRMHLRARIDEASLAPSGPGKDGVVKAYGRSKLANVLFTYALARRLEGSGVTVNALHPGVVSTGMGNDMHGLVGFLWNALIRRFALDAKAGAATSIMLASAPELAGRSGLYVDRRKVARSSKTSYDVRLQERVWHASLVQIARVTPTPLAVAA